MLLLDAAASGGAFDLLWKAAAAIVVALASVISLLYRGQIAELRKQVSRCDDERQEWKESQADLNKEITRLNGARLEEAQEYARRRAEAESQNRRAVEAATSVIRAQKITLDAQQ